MRLLAITPPAAIAPTVDPSVVAAWVDAGAADLGIGVLLREPGASARAIVEDRRLWPLREALVEAGIATLLSVDPSALEPGGLAELVDPEQPPIAGVQLRGDPQAQTVARWRAALGPDAIVGRSVHGTTPRAAPGASYTCLAPIFPPQTRLPGDSKQAIGLEGLRQWAPRCPPLFALGGVSASTARVCLDAGAHGLAGIRLFFGRTDQAGHNVGALVQVFRAAAPIDDVPQAP